MNETASDEIVTRETAPIQPNFTEIDGLKIRYARSENNAPETLLLISPWPESIYAFLPIWRRLAENYAVVAIDLPGFGRSEGHADVLAPEAMGEFVIKTMNALGVVRPHAVGPDIGTATLLFAASNHPDAFASITVGSGAASHPLEIGSTLKDILGSPTIEPFLQIPSSAIVDGVLSTLTNYKAPDFVRDDYIESYAGDRFGKSTAFVRAYPQELVTLGERLPKIETPVQIIGGRHDPFVPISNAEYLAARLPNAKLDVIDSGHLVWEDAAETYASIVVEWARTNRRVLRSAQNSS
jgi:pimeloyl-ACP methyl ester carboxylesterase